MAIIMAYVICLSWQLIDFRIATSLCVLALGSALAQANRRRALLVLVPMALMMGFGLHALFTQVFAIDLP